MILLSRKKGRKRIMETQTLNKKISLKLILLFCCIVFTLLISSNNVYAASKKKIILKPAHSYQLKQKPSKKKKFTYTTTNSAVVSVNSRGVIYAKKTGSATISAKSKQKTYKYKVSVINPKLNFTYIAADKKTKVQLKLSNTIKSKKIKWTSSNKKVATVSKKGAVKTKNYGQATITAKWNGWKYTCNITVRPGKTFKSDRPENDKSQNDIAQYNILRSFQAKYPEGMTFTNETTYYWKGGIWDWGGGCAAFAFELSDSLFGDKPAVLYQSVPHPEKLRTGDILCESDLSHMVIILQNNTDYVTVAEANYQKSVHWNRQITYEEITKLHYKYITRW